MLKEKSGKAEYCFGDILTRAHYIGGYPRPLAGFAGFKEAPQCSGNHIINQNYVSIIRLEVKTKRPKKEARFRLNSSDLRSKKLVGSGEERCNVRSAKNLFE